MKLFSSDSRVDLPPCVGHQQKLQPVPWSPSAGGGRGGGGGEGEGWEEARGHPSDGSAQEDIEDKGVVFVFVFKLDVVEEEEKEDEIEKKHVVTLQMDLHKKT